MTCNLHFPNMSRFTLLIAFLPFFPAQGETVRRAASGLRMELPDKWMVSKNDPEQMVVTAKDMNKEFSIRAIELLKPTPQELMSVKMNPATLFQKHYQLQDVELGSDPLEDSVNGLTQTRIEGTAKGAANRKLIVDWHLTVIEGGRTPLVLLAVGDLECFGDTYDKMLDSIAASQE